MSETIIEGRSIYYEIHGQGDPIVLLHHGFGCGKMWKDVYPALVEAGFMVVIYDRRGYGRSEAGSDFIDFYLSDQFRSESVDDLGRLAGHLGLESFHLLGQCEGGVIGLQFAARYPNRARSVIAASTLCNSETTMVEFNRAKFPKSFSELGPELQAKMIDWHGPNRAESFYEQARSFGGAYGADFFDIRPVLSLVQCPALVMYPDRSVLFDVEQGVAMYRGLPKGELAVIPRCGHNTYEYYPNEYAYLAIRFISSHKNETDESFDPTKVCFS